MATYDLAYPGAAIDAILNTAYFLQEAGYIFQGSASEYSGTPSKRVWLIAPAGSTGFGLSSAVPQGSIGICLYNGTAWVGKVINVLTLDSQPTRNSQNGVTSGGVAATLDEIAGGIMETFASLLFDDETAAGDLSTKLSYAVKFSVSDVYQTVTHLNILAATTSKAGLMSAEDKAKVDSFLTNLRSLTFADTTASADQGTKITETLKATIGGVQEVIDSITLLAATSSKAGLLSASDKAYIDALPATLTNLSNSISGALALMQSMMGYYVCDTAAGTAAKTVAATGYSLTNGGCIRIKMTNANTANNVTLNINSTGAKALYYDGTQASSTNTWEAGEVLEVYYDGTQYQCASGGSRFATGESVNDTSITNTIAEGSSALPTSGAVFEKTKAIDEIAGRVPPAYTSGEYLNGSGVPVSNASWKVIDFLNVQALAAGDVIVWGGITKKQSACICFYDENGAFKNAKSATGSSRTITLGSSDEALGSVKIRASFLESGTPSLTLNGSDVIAANTHYQINGFTELQEDVEALNEEVPKLIEFDEAAADLVYNMVDYDTWDTSGTSGTRVKFIYRNILGATVKVKCESGYSFGIAYYAGSNPSGSELFDTGWKTEETTVNVPASGVGSLTINTRKSNSTAITYDESKANVIKVVYVGTRKVVNEVMKDSGDLITGRAVYKAVNGGSFPYSGGRIRLTDYYCDGQLYMTIRHPSADTSGQGGGIYGDYFIQGGNGGYVRVYDLVTKEIVVDSMPLGSVDSNNHVNNICFSNTIPDGGTFPYMYVSECTNQRRCFVENFSLTGSTLVQTLGYDDSNMKDSNWVVDNEGGYMYLIGNYINRDTVRVIKLPFVEPTSGNHTYTPSDIIEYFDLDGSVGKAYVFQGNVIKDGKLYSCFGGSSGTHRVWVNDLDSHKLLNVIELDQITGGECESINLYNGTMMIGYPNQSKLYQLIF